MPSTRSMVQSSSPISGLSDTWTFPEGSIDSEMISFWSRGGVGEDRESHMRCRETVSMARLGNWCLTMNSIYRMRSISSPSESGRPGPRLSTAAGATLYLHGRRRWRQRLHGVPSSHFSLRRRHSSHLCDACQPRLCLAFFGETVVGLTRELLVVAPLPLDDASWWVLEARLP